MKIIIKESSLKNIIQSLINEGTPSSIPPKKVSINNVPITINGGSEDDKYFGTININGSNIKLSAKKGFTYDVNVKDLIKMDKDIKLLTLKREWDIPMNTFNTIIAFANGPQKYAETKMSVMGMDGTLIMEKI